MSMDVNQFCNEFYLIELAEQIVCRQQEFLPSRIAFQKQVQKLKKKIHENGAKIFAEYLLYAIAGELRHTYNHAYWDDYSMLEELGIEKGIERAAAQDSVKQLSLEQKIEFVEQAEEIFYYGEWEDSYGGDSWGDIANALKQFLTKKWSATVFCDRVFDLRHNGGHLFDKHKMVTCYESVLCRQLDAKRYAKGMEDLYRRLRCEYSWLSKEVAGILKKGERLGYWKISSINSKYVKEDQDGFLGKFALSPDELRVPRT